MTRKERVIFAITFAVAVAAGLVGFDAWLYGQMPWWAALLPVGLWAAGWGAWALLMFCVWWVIASMLD